MTPNPAAEPDARHALADVTAITTMLARLSALAHSAAEWSGDDRHAILARLDHAVDGLTAVRAAVLLAERESGSWQGAGDRTFETWRGRTSRTGQRSATAQVKQAERIAAAPAVASAVAGGTISAQHAAVIGQLMTEGTDAQQSAARSADGQDQLLAQARQLDAGTFATTVARWAATLDPARLERDLAAQRVERYLHVTETAQGTVVKGRLDAMAGHRLTLALEAVSPRPAADDDRDAGQRRADAIDAMASRILALPDTRPGGHVPPQITMILSAQTWDAARTERDRRRRRARPDAGPAVPEGDGATGSGAGAGAASTEVTEPPIAHAPATLEDGTPVPVSELAAAMCDCEITRIVLDADGAPLDLGRAQRVFTGPQRRAVIARDRECAWPDCHAHARWCEVHHIRWWERDTGPTSVANGVLLCSYHHHEVHRRDLVITRIATPASCDRPGVPGDLAGARAPAAPVAQAQYSFHDHAGRRAAGPPTPRADEAPPRPPPQTPPPAPDAPELTWTADPVTGIRMPSFLVAT